MRNVKYQTMELDIDNVTLEDINMLLRNILKNWEVPRSDDIVSELLKYNGVYLQLSWRSTKTLSGRTNA